MDFKEKFLEYYNRFIKRDGAKNLLSYLEKSDFFQAPASTKFHSNFEGGLVKHSVLVYERFLENRLRDAVNFEGTPIKLVFKNRKEEK